MTNSKMNPKVDEFLTKAKKWKEEYETLRKIVLDCELTEDFNILPKEVSLLKRMKGITQY